MMGWIVLFLIAGIVYLWYEKWGKTTTNTQNRPNSSQTEYSNPANRVISTYNNSITETGCMIYFANDRHRLGDKEYRFNYKKVNGSWRAYILRMPPLRGRDPSGLITHRLYDADRNAYVCWDRSVSSLKDMQTISRIWADSIQEYIATGKRFG